MSYIPIIHFTLKKSENKNEKLIFLKIEKKIGNKLSYNFSCLILRNFVQANLESLTNIMC